MPAEQMLSELEMPTIRKSADPAFYVPQLDCLRFLAFFLVFLHHNIPVGNSTAQHVGAGFRHVLEIVRDTVGFGLSLFFFLSSYLITKLLVLEKNSKKTISLRSFYIRRILRIWPLYFAFLVTTAIIGHWLPSAHISIARFAAMSLLAGNWYSIFAGMGPFIIAPLWSISVEEQFYTVWPSAFRLFTRTAFIWFAVLVGAISLTATAILAYRGSTSLDLWMNSFSESIFFATGGLLALLGGDERKPNLLYAIPMIVGCGTIWLAAEAICKINDRDVQPTPLHAASGYLLVAIGCALLLTGSLYFPSRLVPRWLIYLGKISYGLYVFHALAMYIVRNALDSLARKLPGINLAIIFLITMVLSAFSYKYFEKPFLRLKSRFELVKTRAA